MNFHVTLLTTLSLYPIFSSLFTLFLLRSCNTELPPLPSCRINYGPWSLPSLCTNFKLNKPKLSYDLQLRENTWRSLILWVCLDYFTQYSIFQFHFFLKILFHFSLQWNKIPLYICTTFSLSVHQLMNI